VAPVLDDIEGFEWDEGNSSKNWYGHEVTDAECEELFANRPIIVALDVKHSKGGEARHTALGQTNKGRWLFAAFTVRNSLIRVITCRYMNGREVRRYEEEIKRNS
jgi:uncharacterized DUF497 family protein